MIPMKKNIYRLFIFILLSGLMFSCAQDPLYVLPVQFKSASDVFSDSTRAEFFINNAYTDMPADVSSSFNWMENNAMLASACDEAMNISTNKTYASAAQKMSSGNWNPSSMRYYRSSDGAGEIGSWLKWGGYHGNRKANTAIKNLYMLPNSNTLRFRNRLMGEAIFIRAMHHWFLFQKWGGIPIVDKSFEATDNVLLPRNSVQSVTNFIIKSCDDAIALLPKDPYTTPQEVGRADIGSCMALKAKVLLYIASPLYNGKGVNTDGDSLLCMGNYDINRWKDAAKAAQNVVDLGWYQLYTAPTSPSGLANYQQLFNAWGIGTTNKELIFARLRGTNMDTEKDNFPAGLTNATGGTCPSQDLVDAYEMTDGSVFNWAIPAQASAPYLNRDPRFYASIIYNGVRYAKFANKTNYTFETFTLPATGVNATGLAATGTSYYLNKFMDYANCQPDVGKGGTYHNWMYFRYAEILLNLAEASNEFGGPTYLVDGAVSPLTPVQAIDLVRARAGMPGVQATMTKRGIALTQATLRDLIRNERRIELAFEDQRYYDVRRWMIISDLPQYIRGCTITKLANGTFTYDPTIHVENKVFEKKHYFFPIPQTEVNRNPKMKQNPGW
jgi:hypothetical protein